ncbi:hypothetical protein EPO05_03750 [Patescibacteria group bacterium]|nr:MAG: hypothetical protein EPO05_03750 [Patescibacteria group bacterium]
MASVKESTTIGEYQAFVAEVYGLPNSRYFSASEMITNVERFIMRGLKGIRKEENERTTLNLLIAFSWFMSLMNQFHIDIEDEAWKRFPCLCSYCGDCPCSCAKHKAPVSRKVAVDESKHPKTMQDLQRMFEAIYPSGSRNIEHAGIHLAEEVGELSESMLVYRGSHSDKDFEYVKHESADLLSCFLGVFNSMGVSMAQAMAKMFSENCHVCKKAPCECNFAEVVKYKS